MSKKKKFKPPTASPTLPEKKHISPAKKTIDKAQLHFFSKRFLSLSTILFLLAIIIYSSSFSHDYTYDDAAVVVQNRFVQKGFGGIGEILRTQYFEGYDPNSNAMAYRPVPLISLAIETELFGAATKPHHTINILLYALTGILLFYFLHRLLKNYH